MEGQPTSDTSTPVAAPAPAAAPTIDVEAIKAQAAEAARAAAEESRAAAQQMIEAERQRLSAAVLGRPVEREDDISPALQLLLSRPEDSLTYVKEQAKQEAIEQMTAAMHEARHTEATVSRVFSSRPDITTDQMNISVVRGYLDQTDPSLPLEQRLSQAVNSFDRFMDAKTGSTLQQRLASVAGVSSASSPRGGQQEQVDERSSWEQELQEAKARRAAQRNF